jgi:hypothetical protein
MKETSPELQAVLARINASDLRGRYKHHADLVHAIHDIEDVGGRVPAAVHQLAEDLLAEATEAWFENMPV